MPELKEILQPLGIEPLGSSPEVLSTFTDTEISKWMRVVKSGNIKAD